MKSDLKRFSRRIRKVAKDIEDNASEVCRNTASRISKSLTMEDTPVKSGQARNNWRASVGIPITGALFGKSFDTSGTEAHGKNNQQIAKQKPGQDIYITNNLPYIKRLNNGWSKQAPAGFVEAAVQKANTFIKKARLLKPRNSGDEQ